MRSPFVAKSKREQLINLALEKAKVALQNEDVQRWLADSSKAIAVQFKQWQLDRKRDATDDQPGWIGEKFGQGKLERRIEKMAASIDSLSALRPDLTDTLAPVSEAIIQLRLAVDIAGGLTTIKRAQAHFRLDKEIDRLEGMLFEAALPNEIMHAHARDNVGRGSVR